MSSAEEVIGILRRYRDHEVIALLHLCAVVVTSERLDRAAASGCCVSYLDILSALCTH